MTTLAAHGVSIDVPAGWEAELSAQPDPSTLDQTVDPLPAPLVVLHTANFSLPAERDDYGTGAVETMGRNGIFAALVEFGAASVGTMLFAAEGVPGRLAPDDFRSDQLNVAVPGHAGLQHFFHAGPRAFCLYVVIGSHSRRGVLVPEFNRVLSGLSIA